MELIAAFSAESIDRPHPNFTCTTCLAQGQRYEARGGCHSAASRSDLDAPDQKDERADR